MSLVTINSTEVPASSISITKILNGLWKAQFQLPNIPEYRELMTAVQNTEIKMADKSLFTGYLGKPSLYTTAIVCGCLDTVQAKLMEPLFTGQYNGETVNNIMTAICAAAGVTWGSNITYNRYLQFKDASCLYAAIIVAMHCGTSYGTSAPLDWWTDATKLYFGQKGSSKGVLDLVEIGEKTIDYLRQVDKVTGIAWEIDGTERTKTYGTGNREYKFSDKTIFGNVTAYVEDMLNQICYRKYLQLNEPIVKIPVKLSTINWIDEELDVGDKITINDEALMLDTEYRIAKAIIHEDIVSCDLVKAELMPEDQLMPLLRPDSQPYSVKSGVAVQAPGGQTVAQNAAITGTSVDPTNNAWNLLTGLSVPNTDHDVLLCAISVQGYSMNTGVNGAIGYVKVVDTTPDPDEEYPSSNKDYCPRSRWFVNGQYEYDCHEFLITIPKNVKNHSLSLYIYWEGETGDMRLTGRFVFWGHSPHTHPVDDPYHINPFSDTQESLREPDAW